MARRLFKKKKSKNQKLEKLASTHLFVVSSLFGQNVTLMGRIVVYYGVLVTVVQATQDDCFQGTQEKSRKRLKKLATHIVSSLEEHIVVL